MKTTLEKLHINLNKNELDSFEKDVKTVEQILHDLSPKKDAFFAITKMFRDWRNK